MKTKIADAHVDVLYRIEREGVPFYGDTPLQAGYSRLTTGGVSSQVFALYVSPHESPSKQLDSVLKQIDIFYTQVAKPTYVRPVLNQSDLLTAQSESSIGGILSLEGGGCLEGRTDLLRTLFRLGVRGIGLTWNHANSLADGCREPRGAGLTGAGKEVVAEAHQLGMWVDLSHLADAGVEDVFRNTSGPVMASHSNARRIWKHPRNLPDEYIQELVRRQGWMGLVFEASFVAATEEASMHQVLKHVEHVLSLGGENILGFGSDFDGTSNAVSGLSDASHYAGFAQQLTDRYGHVVAEKLLYGNFCRFAQRSLPGS